MSAPAVSYPSGVSTQNFPWPEGIATGVGSMPGTDVRESARIVVDRLEHLPHLPELPARGPGADMIGRGLGLLVEMWAHVEPSGWRLSDRPGRDSRRAASWLGEDLDALEEFTQGYAGPLKVQAVGPWTLASRVELRGGEAVLRDPGACRDLAASLTEGLLLHVAQVRRRVPGAEIVVQLDEPSLTSVLLGRVPTASGYGTHRAVEPGTVETALRETVRALGGTGAPVVVHSCAPGVPIGLLRRAGAAAVSLDFSLLTERDDDEIGEGVEAGLRLFAGVVPSTDAPMSDPGGSVEGVRKLWRRLRLDPGMLGRAVAVTPACGLAGASPAHAKAALAHATRAAKALIDHPE
jgi:Cobalamin-independent synthase, Catalytic domain